ncbi:unnamed protein product [Mytilus edulis]|uniref:Ig-like domain-containing protein n=1 Tax=Mytilus edulis TaxID=6550 RepID=A0A8S3Q7M7_MYTED|nr:unnamed protein product [Mytilus edulis]
MMKKLKREGKDITVHKKAVAEGDIQKLYSSGIFSTDHPVTLQNKVFWDIMLNFGRRGQEGLADLKKTSYAKSKDDKGQEYYKMTYNECDKTHHGVDSKENSRDVRMYAKPGDIHCSVFSLDFYLGKLSPRCTAFFSKHSSTPNQLYDRNDFVKFSDAPTIDIQYFPHERKMKCIPSGVPDRYMFKDWEHTTENNDHIRFLPITIEGNNASLIIPENVVEKDHLQDRGVYICRVSNNISSTDRMFVRQKYYLNLTGTPYFVSSTENTQYGVYLKTAEIKIKFVSVPEYNNYDVFKNGTKFVDYTPIVHKNMKLTDNIYGKNVLVKGSIIYLQLRIDTLDDFNSYEIVVKNEIGCANHTIELVSAIIGGLQPATKYLIRMFSRNLIGDSNRTEDILIQTGNIVMIQIRNCRNIPIRPKRRHFIISGYHCTTGGWDGIICSMALAINVETPEGTNDEIAHYTDISEIDNPQPTPQEHNNSIMSMTNRDIDEVSAEHTPTSSDNDIVSSEYLDDGYEQPYNTLVVTDQEKDDHVYLNTKKESSYENTIPTQNVACEHAREFLKKTLYQINQMRIMNTNI